MEPSLYVVPTVIAEYEEDTVALNAMNSSDKQAEEEVEVAAELETNIVGVEGYQSDLLRDLYGTVRKYKGISPDLNQFTGQEGFVDTVKAWFANIYRMLKNMAISFVEFFSNRVKALRSRYKSLDSVYKSKELKKDAKYPASAKDLVIGKISTPGPGWVVDNMKIVGELIHSLKGAQNHLEKNSLDYGILSAAPYDFKVRGKATHDAISKMFGATGKNVPASLTIKIDGKVVPVTAMGDHTSSVTQTTTLPGNKALRFYCGLEHIKTLWDSNEAPEVKVVDNPPAAGNTETSLTSDRDVINKTMTELKSALDSLENLTPSTTRVIRGFEAGCKRIEQNLLGNAALKENEETKKNLVRYMTWLVEFQRNMMTKPLAMVLNGISAGLDITKAQLG